ncbi:Bacteriophage head-tail adaptor [Tritonibacter mobilis]|uniref:phage head completion protein n=1 Tax=Tritonibacter mobilis TaxID=379347 RepID=UPI000F706730|nr:head-tail adaptor protein [Tritonibacter mobilis]VCU61576.1 Bacteriophage head-tail adaptor [Tritonibacter mobilis]
MSKVKVQFLEPVQLDDGMQRRNDHIPVGETMWAARRDVSDGEKWRNGAYEASSMTRFIIRHGAFAQRLTPQHLIRAGGTEFAILGIKNCRGRNRALEITAVAKV